MKKLWVCILAFLLICSSSFLKVEALFASADKNMEEEMTRGEDQAEDQAIEEGNDDEEGIGEERPGEDVPDAEHESPAGEEDASETEGGR
jgi:hypothetical protein